MDRRRPAVRARDVPVPLAETLAWGEHLLPAGYRDGVAVAVFAEGGRHLGFITLLTDDPAFLSEHSSSSADYDACWPARSTACRRWRR